jgi:hypothetical protein
MKSKIKCWEYFDCSEELRKDCIVYQSRHDKTLFSECWLKFNILEGGHAKRGSCIECDLLRDMYPDICEILENPDQI